MGYDLKDEHMTQGIVKWFNGQKGYGFIQSDDGGKDVFVHISAVERAGMTGLNEGQKVSFDVVANPKNGKASAENLRARSLIWPADERAAGRRPAALSFFDDSVHQRLVSSV